MDRWTIVKLTISLTNRRIPVCRESDSTSWFRDLRGRRFRRETKSQIIGTEASSRAQWLPMVLRKVFVFVSCEYMLKRMYDHISTAILPRLDSHCIAGVARSETSQESCLTYDIG